MLRQEELQRNAQKARTTEEKRAALDRELDAKMSGVAQKLSEVARKPGGQLRSFFTFLWFIVSESYPACSCHVMVSQKSLE